MPILALKPKGQLERRPADDDVVPVGDGRAHRAAARDAAAHRRSRPARWCSSALAVYAYVEYGLNAHAHGRRRASHGVASVLRHVSRVHPRHGQRRAAHDRVSRRRRRRADHGRARRGGRVRHGRPAARDVQEHEPRAASDQRRGAAHRAAQLLEHDAPEFRAEPAAQPARDHRHRLSDRPPHARARAQAAAARDGWRHARVRSTISRPSSRVIEVCAAPCSSSCASTRSSARTSSRAWATRSRR